MIHHAKKALNKPHLTVPVIAIVGIALGVYAYIHFSALPVYQATDSVQGVAYGQDISLAFPKSGRVNSVQVKVGDVVHAGDTLASLDATDAQGVVKQAEGALAVAEANYQKMLNGATGVDIDVVKSAVQTAKTNLQNITTQQAAAVRSAYSNLLNSTVEAVSNSVVSNASNPTISGSYSMQKEGSININAYYTGDGGHFVVSGLVTSTGNITTSNPQPIGDSGLYIVWPANKDTSTTEWTINIPNKKASNYISNLNAYQLARETQQQQVGAAQAALDQSNANLAQKVATARPEDVAQAQAQIESAKGALDIARGAYRNNFIYAPVDGTITTVNIQPGEIAAINQKAVGMTIKK
jgi:HlyD family secretion protein